MTKNLNTTEIAFRWYTRHELPKHAALRITETRDNMLKMSRTSGGTHTHTHTHTHTAPPPRARTRAQ
jgi:hypothetical protein